MTTRKIAVLVGSLRKDSLNRKMAMALAAMAPASLAMEIVEIGDLPFYNQDLEDASPKPAPWIRFREQVGAADAVLFITPEYNRSVPAVLKNAVDVGSRPYGQGVLNGRTAAVISVTPGALGAFGANHHLRQSLAAIGMPVLPAPETYISGAGTLFDDSGAIVNEASRAFAQKFLDAFATWVDRFAAR